VLSPERNCQRGRVFLRFGPLLPACLSWCVPFLTEYGFPLMRTKTLFAMIGCASAAMVCGCMAPWAPPPLENSGGRSGAVHSHDAKAAPAPNPQAAAPGSETDLVGVLDKLQQVRAMDPAAEEKLLAELRRTPAESWPLVAEQFRASLAYHEQLAVKNRNTVTKADASANAPIFETGYDSAELADDNQIEASPSRYHRASLDARPSAPIGELVDPRRADADGVSSEALAKATPYSTPVAVQQAATVVDGAPKEFAVSGVADPITADDLRLKHKEANSEPGANETTVVQARLDSSKQGVDEPLLHPRDEAMPVSRGKKSDPDWQKLVEEAAEDLQDRVAASPSTTAEIHQHVSLRMLWLLEGDTEKALEPIPHVAPAEQDYWSRQFFALATYLDHHSQPDDKRRAAASLTHLEEATSSLRELGSLSLRNLSFCKKVYGYGSIDPFHTDRFSPGQQVALYVEVENYHSQSTEKGFCTSLGSTYEVFDDKGERVSGGTFPDVDDCCRSRRRDFHIQYGLALPEKMAPGEYQLELVVKDRQSDKIGHATVAFEIRGSSM
jgi:hypothetical protein